MEMIPCNHCSGTEFKPIYKKESNKQEIYEIVECKKCGLLQVNPQPSFAEVLKYYSNDYFTQRTDRGYDNYYSDKIRSEVERVFQLNLKDLLFFEWESNLGQNKRTIDIGCAAGYFVNYMKSRGWSAKGIEIAEGPSNFGIQQLGLEIIQEDFLNWDKECQNKFELITLWASIEHLHKPKETLQKIYNHLIPGGRMILSTCRYGILAKWNGLKWRYLNVPEHLYYYTLPQILNQCQEIGFREIKHITYGSGMTMKKDAGFGFKIRKKFMDNFVKIADQGDMMALHLEKLN